MLDFKVKFHVPEQRQLHGDVKCFKNGLTMAKYFHWTTSIRLSLKAGTRIGQWIEPADQGPHIKAKHSSLHG
jgi:hypothetical protein